MPIIPYTIKAKSPELRNSNQKIPYVIIQTMKVNNVPRDMYNAAMSWVQKNPEYDYEFFDNKRCQQFIKEYYPETFVHCFNMLNLGPAKADLFRWLFLNIKGGVYLDIDCKATIPIRNFLREDDQFLTRPRNILGLKHRINHALLASIPNFKLISESIVNAISNILIRYKEKKNEYLPQNICGPSVIGKTLNILKGLPQNSSHAEYENNITYLESIKIRFIPGEKINEVLIPKYKNYIKDCKINNFKRYNKNESAFKYSYAKEYVVKNNVKLDFSLMKPKFI